MRRKIERVRSRVATLSPEAGVELRGWLEAQAAEHGLTTLLAHCEDGALWGVIEGGRLLLSAEALGQPGPRLRWETLVQARLFSADAELLLWPGPAGWLARLRDDRAGDETRAIDERQLLWGTRSERPGQIAPPFAELTEGRQGIRHAPPVAAALPANRRAGLLVRHYLGEDADSGAAVIVDSRLVGLDAKGEPA